MKVVGILLITSLMIFPTAAARPFAKTPEQMAVLAGVGAAAAVCGGLYLSLRFDTAAGPSIVIALAALFSWWPRRRSRFPDADGAASRISSDC